ncbi:MAG: homoserine kinase [Acidobacteriaceae bacterium]
MKTVHLRLPATSANLGPGFDAMALALELFLEIDATPGTQFSIHATGRNRSVCGGLTRNLLVETYKSVLATEQRQVVPLDLRMRNGIPVGMGCGSSAAVRLAAVALASAFGDLGWDAGRIVDYAVRLEGHPDNVAACWHGGLTIAANAQQLAIISLPPPPDWRALLVLPETPVATSKARSILPQSYPRQDVVTNVQCVALLAAAFATGRADLMHLATFDRLHQPYRGELCPLLPALLPLAGKLGVMSVTLSGAGPAVMLLTQTTQEATLREAILDLARPVCPVELLPAGLCRQGAGMSSAG